MKTKNLLTGLFLFVVFSVFSQTSTKDNSYGLSIFTGMSSIQSDYGENGDFMNESFGNLGFNVGANFYFGFIDRRGSGGNHWFKNHAKLYGCVSYMQAKVDHFGYLVDGIPEEGLFKAMHTKTKLVNLGVGFQYFVYNLSEFKTTNINIFSPYAGVGINYSYMMPEVYSDRGPLYENLPNAYRTGDTIFSNRNISTASVTFSAGTRIKIYYNSDLDLNLNWNMMLSDKLDGLVPQLDSNKHNDWFYTVNIGYVYYLDM